MQYFALPFSFTSFIINNNKQDVTAMTTPISLQRPQNITNNEPFHLADILRNDTPESFMDYISQKPQCLQERNLEGRTLLMQAIHYKAYKCALKLLSTQSSQSNIADAKGKTALHYAIKANNSELVNVLSLNTMLVNQADNLGRTPLIYACQKNALESTKILIEHKADAAIRDQHQKTALHYAVEHDDLHLVCAFPSHLIKSLSRQWQDGKESTPLHLAVDQNENLLNHIALNTAHISVRDKNQKTALHLAAEIADEAIICTLLNCGINKDCLDNDQQTALSILSKKNNERLSVILVKLGADPNLGTPPPLVSAYLENGYGTFTEELLKKGASPETTIGKDSLIAIAKELDDTEFITQISQYQARPATPLQTSGELKKNRFSVAQLKAGEHLRVSRQSMIGNSPLHDLLADRSSNIDEISLHTPANGWQVTNHFGETPWLIAAQNASVIAVASLSRQPPDGLNLTVTDNSGNTCLHLAITAQNTANATFFLSRFPQMVNQVNNEGQTPLLLAIQSGNTLLTKRLLKNGAAVDAEDTNKNGAFHYISKYSGSNNSHIQELCTLLAETAASKTSLNKSGQSALEFAAKNCRSVFEKMLQLGFDPNITDGNGVPLLSKIHLLGDPYAIASNLIYAGADRNLKYTNSTVLIESCKSGTPEVCRLLLSNKITHKGKKLAAANPNLLTDTDSALTATIRRLAAKKLPGASVCSSQEVAIIQALLNHGAVPDKTVGKAEKKTNALLLATQENLTAVVQLLLKANSSVNKHPKKTKRAIEIACANDFYDIAELLVKAGAKIPRTLKDSQQLSTRVRKLIEKKSIPVDEKPSISGRISRSSSFQNLTSLFSSTPNKPNRINRSLTSSNCSSTSSSVAGTPRRSGSQSGAQTPQQNSQQVIDSSELRKKLQTLTLNTPPDHPSIYGMPEDANWQ